MSPSYEGRLPREGLYVDPLAQAIRQTILNPWVIGPFWALSSWWAGLVTESSTHSMQLTRSYLLQFAPWLKIATFAGIILTTNDFLSKWTSNNWTSAQPWDPKNEIVVITGGSGGIGGSLAAHLADQGASVVVLDILPLSPELETKSIHYFKTDLSRAAEIQRVAAIIRQDIGHPTVLVNNAGLSRGSTILEGTYHDVMLTLATNLQAPFLLTKEFLPHMIQRDHGHIVNISSQSAYVAPAGLADYAATKNGLIAFHEVTIT
jgi:all-trans-retinol dehydrogenase (NAD+)